MIPRVVAAEAQDKSKLVTKADPPPKSKEDAPESSQSAGTPTPLEPLEPGKSAQEEQAQAEPMPAEELPQPLDAEAGIEMEDTTFLYGPSPEGQPEESTGGRSHGARARLRGCNEHQQPDVCLASSWG